MKAGEGDDDGTLGVPFSRVYIERGTPTADSPQLRQRLGRYYNSKLMHNYGNDICAELGASFGPTLYDVTVEKFLRECDLVMFLDCMTGIYFAVRTSPIKSNQHVNWRQFVASAFREENLCYRLDSECGVRYVPDEEFDIARAATLVGLSRRRFATARQHFEEGISDLRDPSKTGRAIRSIFEAVENVFKLLLENRVVLLGPTEIEKNFKSTLPVVSATEANARNQMLASFKAWVIACQQYRHADGTEEPDPPAPDFAVLMVCNGASFLRWLMTLDSIVNSVA